jgi:AcrR family transcriptional regulator
MGISVKNSLQRRILDVTRELVVQRGVTQVSIRMIASAVGCSVGTIYTYFGNKDVLIHSLIEEGFNRLVESQLSIAETVSDPLERLKALCRNYVRFGLNNPEYYEIMYHLNPERMARYPAEKYRKARRSLEVLAEALEDSTRSGQMKVSDAYLGAHIVWSMLHGLVTLIQFKRVDKRIQQDVLIEQTIQQAALITT